MEIYLENGWIEKEKRGMERRRDLEIEGNSEREAKDGERKREGARDIESEREASKRAMLISI